MKENRHTTAIPADVIEQVKTKLTEVQELLKPYTTVGLTAQDRRRLPKMGTKSLDFVSAAFEIAKQYPHMILPGQVPIEEFEKDWSDAREMFALQVAQEALLQDTSDLAMLAGSEALQAAQAVYASLKLATEQKMPSAKALFLTLKAKNPRGKRTAAPKSPDAEQE